MNLYLKGGILSLRQMKEHYNRFEDGGEVDNVHSTPEQAWMVNWINNRQEVLKENIRDTKDFPALYSDKRLSREAFEEAQKQSRRVLSVKQYNYGRGPQFPTVPDDLYKKARNNVVMSTGTYIPVDHSIIYNRYNNPGRTTQVHELTHSMGANPQLDMLLHDKNLPHKNLREGIEKSSYLDSYQEVYPRLMELRRFLNLDPKKRDYTPKDLEEMRKKVGNTNLLDRYSDKYLLNLLNNIASNKATIETDGRKLAAYGGPLRDEYDNPDQYYDYKTAEEVGNMYDPGTQHWASRDPRTGMILKNSKHPTFGMAIREDQSSGYAPFIDSSTGRYYTLRPEEYATAPNKATLRRVNLFQNGGYKSPEITPSYSDFSLENYVESLEAQKERVVKRDIVRRLKQEENHKNDPKGGYDSNTERWYPHDSYEGGEKTIGYGFKLNKGKNDPLQNLVESQKYLTDAQVEKATDSLAFLYLQRARKVYDKKFSKGAFDSLGVKTQSILGDIQYNPGLSKFPKLMEAAHSKNMNAFKRNYKRYSDGKELGRNKGIAKDIDSIELGIYKLHDFQ